MATTIWWPEFCGNRSIYDAFWSNELSVDTDQPDITRCFRQVVLVWLSCASFILVSVGYAILDIRHRPSVHNWCQRSPLNVVKTVLASGALLAAGACVAADATDQAELMPSDYAAYVIKLLALCLAACLTPWEYVKGIHSSGTLFLFWLFLAIMESFNLYSTLIRWQTEQTLPKEAEVSQSYFIGFCVYYSLVLAQLILVFMADTRAIPHCRRRHKRKQSDEQTPLLADITKGTDVKTSPVLSAPFWAQLSFFWLTRIMIQGYKKVLQFEDLPDICPEDKCGHLVSEFERHYYGTGTARGNDKGKGPKQQKICSFQWALFRSVSKEFLLASAFRATSLPISFVNPQILSLLIVFIETRDPYMWKGIFLAACMLVTNFSFSILINNFLYYGMLSGMKARTIVNAAVYKKALHLSSASKRQTTVGQIVNLMSVDAQKVQDLFLYTTLLWSVPVMIALAMYFLWGTVGPSSLAGFAVLLILVPLNALYFAKKAMKLQRGQMQQKDQRFKLFNEILSGIKVLKLYAWEYSFLGEINGCRENELKNIKAANYINAFGSMCWLLAPYLVSLAVFATFVLSSPDHILDANTAFVSLSLINLLNWPMALLPMGVNNTVQGLVSMKRISKFLDLEELDEDCTEYGPSTEEVALSVDRCEFSWSKSDKAVLSNINMEAKRGSLVAVVGAVGSGKSSLISSLLAQLHKVGGSSTVTVNGSIAYVPQQAWIQNATLRDNILFGRAHVSHRYQDICEACALTPDLEILPGGDMIEIGEKGINLSGGQKQRVSLARAVYQDEDIYLLDDPLSAVDAHVAKHLFEKVIGPTGLLKQKTRVLVTHSLTFLPQVDTIFVLRDGTIAETGTYDQLLESNGPFADFVTNFLNDRDSDSEDVSEEFRDGLTESESQHSSSLENSIEDNESKTERRRSSSRRKSGTDLRRKSSNLLRRKSSEMSSRGRRSSRRSRGESVVSDVFDTRQLKEKAKLIKEETSEQGNVRMQVIRSYAVAGGMPMLILVIISHSMFMAAQVFTNIWLSDWSTDSERNITDLRASVDMRLGVYGGLGVAQGVSALIEAFAVAYGCYIASRVLHAKLLQSIMHAPMAFFDTTPLGRIMNRFSKDLDVVDTNLPLFIRQWLFAMAPVVTTVLVISYSTPIFVAVIIPLIALFIVLQRIYIATARQLKRIDSVRRSPIYTHFDESVVGGASIRAYRRVQQFLDKCERLVDESQRAWFLQIVSYRWCGILMDFIGSSVVFFASLFAVLQKDTISASLAGLSISYSLQITVYMNALIRNSSELETYIVSVERIEEYSKLDSEAAWEIPGNQPRLGWPAKGAIQFKNYSTRYRPGLDLVLKSIDISIAHGEKIGIVGRTGAGKSSLSLALFRIIESARGKIVIDGQNVASIGLHDLRSKISIIPQDPVIFSGSLRRNLDPFSYYSDRDIWEALGNAHLKQFVNLTPEGLDYECGEGGEALSVGQRQLVCLARALLKKSRIVVLDEATAAVDLETDSLIQNTINTQLTDCTILTVAHRLRTVLNYDRILVLDAGRVQELAPPSQLLSDKTSVFYSMAKDAGLIS